MTRVFSTTVPDGMRVGDQLAIWLPISGYTKIMNLGHRAEVPAFKRVVWAKVKCITEDLRLVVLAEGDTYTIDVDRVIGRWEDFIASGAPRLQEWSEGPVYHIESRI